MANAALFLASDEASYITGVAVPVEGGFISGGSQNEIFEVRRSQIATQAIAKPATPQAETAFQPSPVSYKELVALFEANKEGPLHAQLYNNVRPVRCEPGMLEIHVAGNAPANLASRLTQCLTTWTRQRWMVSISAKEGEPTLAEQDREREQKRKERALSHPLVQAVIKAFPDAKMTALRQKAVAAMPMVGDDAATQGEMDDPVSLPDMDNE